MRQVELGAHGLAYRYAVQHRPPVSERLDEDDPTAGLGEVLWQRDVVETLTAR